MKPISNSIMLITYADSLGCDLKELKTILDRHFQEAIGGVHILPFFPSSADRGFAPITYQEVDKSFGTWEDIRALSENYYLMFDYMVNHISAQSQPYRDFLQYKDQSAYKDFFIRYKDFWENGEPTQEEIDVIYKRKPRAPYVTAEFADGSTENIWCTFNEEQIDINCSSDSARAFLNENLSYLAEQGASLIRLDAFAYTTKKAGSSCFFIEPEVWEILNECQEILKPYGVRVLPEIHEHYTMQLKLSEHGYLAYDFALPMLLIHALYSHQAAYLKNWIKICPRSQFTTLDTHDGIGVVDVIDLLPEAEIELTKEYLYKNGANVKRKYSSAEYNNLDIYQINCTYYSALGNNDALYLIARAVQFFCPGIPQVYYVGLLAGSNDIELLEATKNGRDINRHYYSAGEIEKELQRPVITKLLRLMKFRNTHPAFDGVFELVESGDHELVMTWKNQAHWARLDVDLQNSSAAVTFSDPETHEKMTIKI